MSDTPKTDVLKRGHPLPVKSSWADEIIESHERLERELTSVTKERDGLQKSFNVVNSRMIETVCERDSLQSALLACAEASHRAKNAMLASLNNQGGIGGKERFPRPIWKEIQVSRNQLEEALSLPAVQAVLKRELADSDIDRQANAERIGDKERDIAIERAAQRRDDLGE
jgi:hypothetical protein